METPPETLRCLDLSLRHIHLELLQLLSLRFCVISWWRFTSDFVVLVYTEVHLTLLRGAFGDSISP